MPRDSNGIYSLPSGYQAVSGEIIQPSQHNQPLEDIAQALTGSLPRNGAAPMTGEFKMGGNRISGLGDPTADTDALSRRAGDARYGRFPVAAQCRLVYQSATEVKLARYNGRGLYINGKIEEIPAAGVIVNNTGAPANTLYYVYAYMDDTTMKLERSTTGYVVDTTEGLPVKSDDPARTLVGMVRTGASSQFYSTASELGVASYYNRRLRMLTSSLTTSTASTSPTNSGSVHSALVWNGDGASHFINGNTSNNTAGGTCAVRALGVANTAVPSYGASFAVNARAPVCAGGGVIPPEGLVTFQAAIWVLSGTGSFELSQTSTVWC